MRFVKKYALELSILTLGVISLYRNPLFTVSLFILSLLVGLAFYRFVVSKNKDRMVAGVVMGLIMLLNFVFLYINYPDRNVLELSNLEKHEMTFRRGSLRVGLIGQIYGRKIGNFYFEKFVFNKTKVFRKISYPMDISKYFSINSNSPLSYIILPFFIVGFLFLIKHSLRDMLIYFTYSSFASVIILQEMTIVLYFPIIFVSFAIGCREIIIKLKK